MTSPHREKTRKQHWPLLLGLGLAGAVLILPRVFFRGSAERLREMPLGVTLRGMIATGTYNGLLLYSSPDNRTLEAESVGGGRRRLLRLPLAADGTILDVTPTHKGALIRTSETFTASGVPVTGGGGVSSAGYNPGSDRVRLWEAPLDGGAARELLPHLRMVGAVLAGRTCFWLRRRPPRQVQVRLADPGVGSDRMVWQTVEESDVMATPVDGGPSRTVASAVRSSPTLEPLGEGVSWSVHNVNATGHDDRYFALPPELRVRVLPDCTGRPYLHDGRLYWIDQIPPQSPGEGPRRLELATARTDGTDRRVLVNLLNSREWAPTALARLLGVHQGRLYGLLYYRAAAKSNSPPRELPVLCRIGPDTVDKVIQLPPETLDGSFDGGYLYYSLQEQRENWLDWSNTGLLPKRVQVLYRSRIPD